MWSAFITIIAYIATCIVHKQNEYLLSTSRLWGSAVHCTDINWLLFYVFHLIQTSVFLYYNCDNVCIQLGIWILYFDLPTYTQHNSAQCWWLWWRLQIGRHLNYCLEEWVKWIRRNCSRTHKKKRDQFKWTENNQNQSWLPVLNRISQRLSLENPRLILFRINFPWFFNGQH